MMLDARYRGFFAPQLFASMTRSVLWGGTLLLYATYVYNAGPQLLGGLAATSGMIAAFTLFGLCSFVTAALLAFSVKETVGRKLQ